MRFDPTAYGAGAAAVLTLASGGARRMPLSFGVCASEAARERLTKAGAERMFDGARSPLGALAGLLLYFDCFEESHRVSQDLHTIDGSFWHAIAHRREPDAGNSAYWFRRVGVHPVFPALRDAAADLVSSSIAFKVGAQWDPFAFIELCEQGRAQPGSETERIAMEIQLAEWQLLFDRCARRIE